MHRADEQRVIAEMDAPSFLPKSGFAYVGLPVGMPVPGESFRTSHVNSAATVCNARPRTALSSLRSDVCPVCAGHKRTSQTMCVRDYRRLPADLQRSLYQRIGAGYEQALQAALITLNASTFHLPPTARKEH
jgi:hypothetical protein